MNTIIRKKKPADSIPEEFAHYEEAAEFWDTHDTTDYPEAFRTVEAKTKLRSHHNQREANNRKGGLL
jgi:hypothetical protein